MKGPNKDRPKSKNYKIFQKRPNVTCWNCGEKKSLLKYCTRPKRKQNHKLEDDNDSINSVEDIENALILSMESLIEYWILDSGASFHLSQNKKLFQNFKYGNFEKTYLWNNKAFEIEGNGDVCIKTIAGN